MADKLRSEIAEYLKRYIYALVDPRDGVPFYVGKGTESRVLQHGLDAAAWAQSGDDTTDESNEKFARIAAIEAAGLEVDVWILRRGLTTSEYSAVESTLIDFLKTFPIAPQDSDSSLMPLQSGIPLTNKVRGAAADSGITRLRDIERDFSAPPLRTTQPLLLITLNSWIDHPEELPDGRRRDGIGFKPEWTDQRQLVNDIEILGESVCCWWTFNPANVEAAGIKHIVALYHGVTRGLFEIVPGSARTIPTTTSSGKPTKRSGFSVKPVLSGELWDNTIGNFGHRVTKKRGEQAQYRYWPYTDHRDTRQAGTTI